MNAFGSVGTTYSSDRSPFPQPQPFRTKVDRSDNPVPAAHHKRAWRPSDFLDWLNEKAYREKSQPPLTEITVPRVRSALGISMAYATDSIVASPQSPLHPSQSR
jgi:hypothetical protein